MMVPTIRCRILQSKLYQRRYVYCLLFLTFVWTFAWIVSFHQSLFVVDSIYNFYNVENVTRLPPILSSSSSPIWNLLPYYDSSHVAGGTYDRTTIGIPPYITDSLCSGCRHSFADPTNPDSERCGKYIDQQYRRHQRLHPTNDHDPKNTDIIISVIGDMVAQQFPNGCSKCQGRQEQQQLGISRNRSSSSTNHDRNDICSKDQFQYWRYDSVAPLIRSSATQDQWFPSSKPKQYHFSSTTSTPSVAVNSDSTTVKEETLVYYFGTSIPILSNANELFMEYNPSIAILPKNQYKSLQFKSSIHDYYVISFRISNQNYCFHPKDRQRQIMFQHQALNRSGPILSSVGKDYMGIIIVNASSSNFPNGGNVDIVYDTIVDLKAIHGFSNAQDFRLFVLQNQLYISSYDTITPIWFTTTSLGAVPTHSRKDLIQIPTVFSKVIDQQQLQLNVWIRKSLSCVNCHRKRAFCGKNFNYFVGEDTSLPNNGPSVGTVFVEVWPTGPHTVHSVDLNQLCRRGLDPITKYISSASEVQPSFPTMEEVDFPSLGGMESIFTRGRGSACCVPMLYPNSNNYKNRTVLVGIQHTKTPSQRNKILPPNVTSNHYLSSFYAFESTPPYNIIAKTGWFCLGFPDDPSDDKRTDMSLLHRVTAWRKLVLGGRSYNCPRIHFVSGMTIKANDPDSVILAYGINDCYSRFVEIQLSDIYDLLFIGPSA